MKIFAAFITMIAILTTSMAVHAAETCDSVLKICNDALNAEITLNNELTQVNDDQANLIKVLNTDVGQEAKWQPIALGAAAIVVIETLVIVFKH